MFNKLALLVIDFYKMLISPIIGPCCRYRPSCSSYCKEAFEKYSFFKALKLSLNRIARCNPMFESKYYPLEGE